MAFKITIPESLSEVKLKDYQKFIKLTSKEGISEEFSNRKAFELFLGVNGMAYHGMRMRDREYLMDELRVVLSEKPELQQTFVIGDIEYGLIPDWDEITFKEFHDLSDLKDTVVDLHRILAILYRPIINKKGRLYSIQSYNGYEIRQEIMSESPASVGLGVIFFCSKVSLQLLKPISTFLPQVVKDQMQHLTAPMDHTV